MLSRSAALLRFRSCRSLVTPLVVVLITSCPGRDSRPRWACLLDPPV